MALTLPEGVNSALFLAFCMVLGSAYPFQVHIFALPDHYLDVHFTEVVTMIGPTALMVGLLPRRYTLPAALGAFALLLGAEWLLLAAEIPDRLCPLAAGRERGTHAARDRAADLRKARRSSSPYRFPTARQPMSRR